MADQRPEPTEAQLQKSEEWKQEGNNAFRAKNYTEALHCYTEAISLNPNSETLFSNRSATLLSLRRLPLALNDAKRAVDLGPTWAKAHRRKANVLEAMKRYSEAAIIYTQALEVMKKDTTLISAETKAKEIGEVRKQIATMQAKMRLVEPVQVARLQTLGRVEELPGLRVVQEAEKRMGNGEPMGLWPPRGSAKRQLWLGQMQWEKALTNLEECRYLPHPSVPPPGVVWGKLQTLEGLTSALMEDTRAGHMEADHIEKLQICYQLEQQSRNAVGPELSAKQAIQEYSKRLTEPIPKHIVAQSGGQLEGKKGWDYVRPALQLSIRTALMNGILYLNLAHNPGPENSMRELNRAVDIAMEARKQWPDVDDSLRGRTLAETFVRQMTVQLCESIIDSYVKTMKPSKPGILKKERSDLLNELRENAQLILDSVRANPTPERIDFSTALPDVESQWWSTYYTHYAGPRAKAYSYLGFFHMHYGQDLEELVLRSPDPKLEGRADHPEHLGKAAYCYAQAAAWAPPDEVYRCNHLWNSIYCLVRRGGFYVGDFELVRDMATKAPEFYVGYFDDDLIPDNHCGKVIAAQVQGTVVGKPSEQICSPVIRWPSAISNPELEHEVTKEHTLKVIGDGGMLLVTKVIRNAWKERLELGEDEDAMGGEAIWESVDEEFRKEWERIYREHVEDRTDTFEA